MIPRHESPDSQVIRFSLSPTLIAVGLAVSAALLGVAHVVLSYWKARLPGHPLYGLPAFFDLGGEGNLPTWFSALCLLTSGLLCLLLARADHAKQRAGWIGLGLGFTLMSADEAAQIHDGIINPVMHSRFGSFDMTVFHYGWIVVAMCVVAVLALLYLGFLTRLPRERFEPALGPPTVSGLAVETDDATGLAVRVKSLRLGGVLEPTEPLFWVE